MKTKIIFAFTSIFLISLSLVAQPDFSGKWKGEGSGPQGPMELIFNFQVDGQGLTGSVEGPMGSMEMENGKIDGSKFSFDVSFNGFTIWHKCEVVSKEEIFMKTEMMEMTLEKVEDE